MFGKKNIDFDGTLPQQGVVAGSLTSNTTGTSVTAGGARVSDSTINYLDGNLETAAYSEARQRLIAELLDQLDFQAMETLPTERKRRRVDEACDKIIPTINIPLTVPQISLIKSQALDDILGFGPLEPLLRDTDVNDIMVNTSKRVFIERHGKICPRPVA